MSREMTKTAPTLLYTDNIKKVDRDTAAIMEMLTYTRCENSLGEQEFIARYIVPTGAKPDKYGNYFLVVGDVFAPKVAFCCHTDTVHSDQVPPRQPIYYAAGTASLYEPDVTGLVLGADCGAGVWLCLEMIRAGVPGLYIFHRAEERGGKGSTFIAEETPAMLEGIEAIIAFDRRGTTDVITHQAGGRCASDAFARSLAKLLPPGSKPSPDGIFTDTANYTHLVRECTNISVGYEYAHTAKETLDVKYLKTLRDHLVKADWSTLDIKRDVTDYEFEDPYFDRYSCNSFTSSKLERYIERNPDIVAEFLEAHGYTVDDIEYFVYGSYK